MIRFNNKAVREQIYRNRVPRDHTKRGLFIHESLTASKTELVGRCSKLRKDGKISTYYTQGGSVFVKKLKDQPSVMITPHMSDNDILTRLERQPASFREAAARSDLTTEASQVPAELTAPAQASTNEIPQRPIVDLATVSPIHSPEASPSASPQPTVTEEQVTQAEPVLQSGGALHAGRCQGF